MVYRLLPRVSGSCAPAYSPDQESACATPRCVRRGRPALPVVVVSALLCLGAANIVARATWREVEDGVLWTPRAEGVVAAEIAAGTPAAARRPEARRPAARDRRPAGAAGRRDVVDGAARGRARARRCATPCCGSARAKSIDVRIAPIPERPGRALLPAGRRRHLHAAGRRRRAAAPAARSGDAALLLAGGRLLRRLHVLVQRPARSSRLGLLLGRRDLDPACCRRCSSTSRWCSRSGRGAGRRARRARARRR